MNLLEQVCRELGVGIGKRWLGNDGCKYVITKFGELYNRDYATLDNISRVLTGELKPVWKPKDRERYYIPRMNYEMYDDWCWVNDKNDNWWLENSMIFKTKEEAIECANRMLKTVREYQHEIS